MGRQRRPYLPGGIFHLTARTLRREHLFTAELRTAALRILVQVLPRSQARLMAVAVMSNHLHIVVQQGDRPLSALMQPLLRRLALRLQETHRLDGPMFWRHYAARSCRNPMHVRNAIVYTHLNPVRAKICRLPSEYRWTSHSLYTDDPSGNRTGVDAILGGVLDPYLSLPLFATERETSIRHLHRDYRAYVDWRLSVDELASAGEEQPDTEPDIATGTTWPEAERSAWLTPVFHQPMRTSWTAHTTAGPAPPDLAAIARRTLEAEAPEITLNLIRGRGGKREYTRLRRVLIRRLHASGYRNIQIARFLDLSESAVSAAIRISST